MIVAVFDLPTRAVDGQYALRRLDDANSIALYASALIDKAADGELKVRQQNGGASVATLSGGAIGAIIGLLGGPVGAAPGAGGLIGRLSELDTARIDVDFLDDVGSVLTSSRSAVVAEIDEDWTAPVDDAVEALGGLVLRRTLAYDTETQAQRSIDALKKDHALLRAELAVAAPGCRQRLQARIAAAEARLGRKHAESKARREAIRHQADARLAALRAKAARAIGDLRVKQDERIAAVERAYGEWLDRMDDRADRSSSGR
jgi:uncharacterized membrane protein